GAQARTSAKAASARLRTCNDMRSPPLPRACSGCASASAPPRRRHAITISQKRVRSKAARSGPQWQLGGRRCCESRLLLRQIDAERVEQTGTPGCGQPHGAAVALALEPAELAGAAEQLGTDQTGDVIAPFAPVEARPAEDALAAQVQIDAEVGEAAPAGIGDLATVVGKHDVPAC